MLVNILVSTFGILMFLFIFWKRLKEDYSGEIIFKAATYILVGIGVGFTISKIFFPLWFFWTSFFAGILGFVTAFLLLKVKFFETLEAFIISSLPGLSLVFLENSVSKSSLSSFLAFLAILVYIGLSYYFDTHYKNFTWFKSGRIGFAGLTTFILLFFTRFVLAIFKVSVLSFVGFWEIVLSGVLVVTGFVLLFRLSKVTK